MIQKTHSPQVYMRLAYQKSLDHATKCPHHSVFKGVVKVPDGAVDCQQPLRKLALEWKQSFKELFNVEAEVRFFRDELNGQLHMCLRRKNQELT